MILLILILLDNDIAENPGPFSDEIGAACMQEFFFKII
jgi:hypothetical protein